jgi:hypothetical protein
VGIKSEINGIAQIAAKKAGITKQHNKLINRLREYILWRQRSLKQSMFDALVIGWKKGRDILIEAKTASEGTSGRSQVRQAIGQLYDYRFTYMPNNTVELAVLLPKEPSSHVKELLFLLSGLRFCGSKENNLQAQFSCEDESYGSQHACEKLSPF